MPRRARIPKHKTSSPAYRQLWRLVDGAVRQCFLEHPDYLSDSYREITVRTSIVKRVAGLILGYAGETAEARSSAEAGDSTETVAKAASVRDDYSRPEAGEGSGNPRRFASP